MRELDDITGQIVDAALNVHRRIGPGLLESVYEKLLAAELKRRGLVVERQKPIGFDFNGIHFRHGFRLDILVEALVAVEVKSVTELKLIHRTQLLTYIRLASLPAGLLINFGGLSLRKGLVRLVNHAAASDSGTPDVSRHRIRSGPET